MKEGIRMKHGIALALIFTAVFTVEICFPAAVGCVAMALVFSYVPASRTR